MAAVPAPACRAPYIIRPPLPALRLLTGRRRTARSASFPSSLSSLRLQQVEDSPLRFDAYLSLPPEEYSLLDPKWIQRDGPDLFKLSVPLGARQCPQPQGAPPPRSLPLQQPPLPQPHRRGRQRDFPIGQRRAL